MKIVIIGGGVAGLTLGGFLTKQKAEIVISERSATLPIKGHAFLMHADGLSILNELNPDKKAFFIGKKIDAFSLRRPAGNEIKYLQLNSWKCIKRGELLKYLTGLFPQNEIKYGREFSHFIYENEKIVAAAFYNGEVEYGDLFIGADGGNSKVRKAIFNQVDFTPVTVKEIVGITYNKKISKDETSTFIKFLDNTKGLAFGLIPTSDTEFVWFLQYDPSIADLPDSTPDELKSFCLNLVKDFPTVVNNVLKSNDFTNSYIWNTRDFDLLPSFHKGNVVLIGDAAHLALPFTSAGTTNAIVDAKILAESLNIHSDMETAFKKYYELRATAVKEHIFLGRKLKHIFLNPQNHNDDDLPVPLILESPNDDSLANSKLIQVLYFTDPICSTCWIIQPLLRKLKLEYGKYINVNYCMGGLLPSWDGYTKGKINNPSDAAKHWEEVCAFHEMPLDGDIWLEDPLNSSYPPSIAFKAAQMQDNNKAILFLRRIKEMVFLEKKNIIKWDFLERAAFEVGLDSARLLRDFNGRAKELFKQDLTLANDLGVTSFPTLIFSDSQQKKITLKGYKSYKHFEEVISDLIPSVEKDEIDTDPKSLFTEFPTMADKEFAFLSNRELDEARKILIDLNENGYLEKYESKNGTLWKNKFLWD